MKLIKMFSIFLCATIFASNVNAQEHTVMVGGAAGLDINEERSDGSANAFTTSENMEQDHDDNNPYFRKNK